MNKPESLVFFTAIILNLVLGINTISDLPSHFPRCHRSDPKMEECLLNATEYVRPYVSQGIQDFLPPFKQFIVPEITIDQRGNRAFNFFVHITNLSVFGMDQYKFKSYKFKKETPISAFLDVSLPHLYITGDYSLKGNLFFASLKGNGHIHANITNTNCSAIYIMEEVKKNGIGYLHSMKVISKIHLGNVTDYGLDGLFNESKDLEKYFTDIVKKNIQILLDEITPAIEKFVTTFLSDVIGKAVEKIPYEKVYPK